MTTPTTTVRTMARLSHEQYTALEKMLPPPMMMNEKTTDLMAGQLLGVQLVLRLLREGFVV